MAQEIPVRCGSVSVFVIRHRDGACEVLLMRRTGTLRGEWCQVAGAIEAGETAWKAALREVEEETGLRPLALYSTDICEQFQEADRDAISLLPVFVAVAPPDASITLNHEHSEFRWTGWDGAAALVPFAGQRHVLRHMEREFGREPDERLRIA